MRSEAQKLTLLGGDEGRNKDKMLLFHDVDNM